jgi:hypothetical protein
MSNLDDLKQQLYAKLQANIKPEKPLTQEDLLKVTDLPAYEKSQRLRKVIEQQRSSVYDLAPDKLPPTKGKVQAPKPAFDAEATDV